MIETFLVDGVHLPWSNFYRWQMDVGGRQWPTVEHYYQAQKTRTVADMDLVYTAATPRDAKRAGRKIELRPDWEAVKLEVMRTALELKFTPDNEMGALLLETGDQVMVEGNNWGDRYWGRVNGVGQNWLGHLLMARRAELRGLD